MLNKRKFRESKETSYMEVAIEIREYGEELENNKEFWNFYKDTIEQQIKGFFDVYGGKEADDVNTIEDTTFLSYNDIDVENIKDTIAHFDYYDNDMDSWEEGDGDIVEEWMVASAGSLLKPSLWESEVKPSFEDIAQDFVDSIVIHLTVDEKVYMDF